MIGGISSVEAFGMAEAVSARFDEVDAALGDENFKAVFFSSLANPTMRFANALVLRGVGALRRLCGALRGSRWAAFRPSSPTPTSTPSPSTTSRAW